MKKSVFILLLCASGALFGQDSAKAPIDMSTMQNYFMVFLYRVENRPELPKEEVTKIQEGHLANIARLAEAGKIVLAGPFLDDTPLRGIFVFNTATKEEAEQLCATDPAIAGGRLRVEIKPWFGPKALIHLFGTGK